MESRRPHAASESYRDPGSELRPEEAPLYGSVGECGDSLGPGQLQALISEYEERAVIEEREGCFGLAEVFWKRAVAIATKHFPEDKVTARVARSLGLFLYRFIPGSLEPIPYLRTAVKIEKHLDSSSIGTLGALLDLARVLISTYYFEEAELILQAIIAENKEISSTLRAVSYLGRLRYSCDDLLEAEKLLRENIEKARVLLPGSEILSESLCILGEILVSMERFSEVQTLLEELFPLSKRNLDENFYRALTISANFLKRTARQDEITSLFDSVLAELQGVHPYILAAILTIQSRVRERDISTCCCLQALALYRSVRAKSWYVIRQLNLFFKLIEDFEFKEKEIIKEVDEQMSELMNLSPACSVMIMIELITIRVSDTAKVYWKKVGEWITREAGDELASGEAVLRFRFIKPCAWGDSFYSSSDEVETRFVQQFPNSTITARLYAITSSNESTLRQSLELQEQLCMPAHYTINVLISIANCLLYAKRRDSPQQCGSETSIRPQMDKFSGDKSEILSMLQRASDLCARIYTTAAESSYWERIASQYEKAGEPGNAESIYQRIVMYEALVNSQSERYANCLSNLGIFYERQNRNTEAEECMKRAAEILLAGKEHTIYCVGILRSLFEFYSNTEQSEKQLQFFSECIRFLKSIPARQLPDYRSCFLAECMCYFATSCIQLKRILAVWDGVALFTPISDSLQREVQRFCEFGGRPTVTVLPRIKHETPRTKLLEEIVRNLEKQHKYEEAEIVQVKVIHHLDVRMMVYAMKNLRNSYQSH